MSTGVIARSKKRVTVVADNADEKPEVIEQPEESKPVSKAEIKPVKKTGEWRFVKNMNLGEKIKFKEGYTIKGKDQDGKVADQDYIVFPSQLFIVTDSELAEQILKVADQFGVCEQNGKTI